MRRGGLSTAKSARFPFSLGFVPRWSNTDDDNPATGDRPSPIWILVLGSPARKVHPSIAGHGPRPGFGPMMVWERAGLFSGSRVQARMGRMRLGTRIHLTFGNLCSFGGRPQPPLAAAAGWN